MTTGTPWTLPKTNRPFYPRPARQNIRRRTAPHGILRRHRLDSTGTGPLDPTPHPRLQPERVPRPRHQPGHGDTGRHPTATAAAPPLDPDATRKHRTRRQRARHLRLRTLQGLSVAYSPGRRHHHHRRHDARLPPRARRAPSSGAPERSRHRARPTQLTILSHQSSIHTYR